MNLILVRHAQNQKEDDAQPGKLTTVGDAYARNLPITRKLGKIIDNIEAIYASEVDRCVDTVKPLSAQCGKPVQAYNGDGYKAGGNTPSLEDVLDRSLRTPGPEEQNQWVVICCRSVELDDKIKHALVKCCGTDLKSKDVSEMLDAQGSGYDMFVAFSHQDAQGNYQKARAFQHSVPDVDDQAMNRSFAQVPRALRKKPEGGASSTGCCHIQ